MIGTSVKRKGESASASTKRSKLTPGHSAGNVSNNIVREENIGRVEKK